MVELEHRMQSSGHSTNSPLYRFAPELDDDFSALEDWLSRHQSRLYCLALHMMKDRGDAEEVLQETFVSAWTNRALAPAEPALGSWLLGLCAKSCLALLRRKVPEESVSALESRQHGPRFESKASLQSSLSQDWAVVSDEEKAVSPRLRQAIEDAVAELPNEDRAVFLLKDVAGLSYHEIAEAIAETVPAVKGRLHGARLALREAVDSHYGAGRSRTCRRS
jgi:RNA polymerase sigma-70 factor (ECF subfamily)